MKLTMQENGNKILEVFGDEYDKHVEHIANNLRPKDFDEVFAATGDVPLNEVLNDWHFSLRRWMVFNNADRAVAIMGVLPIEVFSKIGVVWLLGTNGLDKMKKFFVKHSKLIIEEMKKCFKILFGYVDVRYLKAVKWLKWCGFTIEEVAPFGALQMPFHRFYMECN